MKKKLVAVLLFICCLFAGWLLLTASSPSQRTLKSFAQIDSLITQTLYNFGLKRHQIRHAKTVVDSSFSRKTFIATVTGSFPETKLHLALKQTFRPFDVRLPARVLFPEKDLRIYFTFNNTVLRTLLIDTEEPDSAISGLVDASNANLL